MKKIIFGILLFILTFLLNAESALTEMQTYINKGLYKNNSKIERLSEELTIEERALCIKNNTLKLRIPLLLNGLVGYGVGSFLNKDYIAGGIHCSIDTLCFITSWTMNIFYGYTFMKHLYGHCGDISIAELVSATMNDSKQYRYVSLINTGIILLNRIAQMTTLALHTRKYNNVLYKTLSPKPVVDGNLYCIPVIGGNTLGLAVMIVY